MEKIYCDQYVISRYSIFNQAKRPVKAHEYTGQNSNSLQRKGILCQKQMCILGQDQATPYVKAVFHDGYH